MFGTLVQKTLPTDRQVSHHRRHARPGGPSRL